MPSKRSKKYVKSQFDALEELQDELDSVDARFRELRNEKAALKKDIKAHRSFIISAGAEDQLQEWDEKREGEGDAQGNASRAGDAPDADADAPPE